MSRDKGIRAAGWVANYLHPWWPDAVKTPPSRRGRDIENTPGVAFEVKTGGASFRTSKAWNQAEGYREGAEAGVVIYLPPGVGERQVDQGWAFMPVWQLMEVLEAGGYAPPRKGEPGGQGPDVHRA